MASSWDQFPAVEQAPKRGPVFIADQGAIDDANRADTSLGYQGEGNQRDSGRYEREGDKDTRQGMADLRKEFSALPEVKAYKEAATALDTGLFTKDDGSGDGTLLYQYSKLMDPMGSVREGDVQLAQSGAGYLSAKAAELKKNFGIGGGGSLPPEIREGLRREMIGRFNSLNRAYNQRRQEFRGVAGQAQYDPEYVIGEHAGAPFLERFRDYDKRNGIGTASQPQKPAGGAIPGATADNITFDMDTGTGAFGSQIEAGRLTPQQNGALKAFLQANRGNPNFGPEQMAAFSQSLGLDGLAINADGAFYDAVRSGAEFSTDPNYEQADEARRVEMEQLAKERYGDDPATRASLLAKGGMMNWSDEAAGVLGGVYDAVTGGSPVEGYQRERDLERYVQEESRGKYGVGYEVAGSLATPLGWMKAPKTAAEFASQGAKIGAIAGAGEGEGITGTLGGATVGATLGGGTGLGGKKLYDAAAGTGVGQKIAGALTRSPNTERQAFAEAAERQGMDYLPADIPGAKKTQFLTSIAKATLGGVPLAEAAQKIATKARDVRDRIAGTVGEAADNVGAGQATQRGMEIWKSGTADRGSELYNAIPIKPDTTVDLTATRAKLAELNNGISSNAELAALVRDPKMAAYQKALDSGDLSWGDIKSFRSYIGEKAGRPTLQQDTSKDSLDALYGSLSQDIERAAAAHSPEAAKAFSRANSYWRGRQGRLHDVMTKLVGKDGNMSPEATFAQIERWGGTKGGDVGSLARAVRSLPPEEAATVRASIIDRLGDANPGSQNAANDSFSPDVFLTQWAKLGDRSKAVLFQGDHRKALDDLATVLEGSKFSRGFDNNSKTGIINTALSSGAVALADPVTGIAFAALQYGGGKLLASPRIARWVVGLTKKPNPSAQLAHVKQLSAIAKSEPAIANDIFGLQQRLADAFAQPQSLRAAAEENDDVRNPKVREGERDDAQ